MFLGTYKRDTSRDLIAEFSNLDMTHHTSLDGFPPLPSLPLGHMPSRPRGVLSVLSVDSEVGISRLSNPSPHAGGHALVALETSTARLCTQPAFA